MPCSPTRSHGSLSPSPLVPALPHPCPGPPLWAPGSLAKQDLPLPPSTGIYKGFCLDVIRNKYECELQGAKQHLEVNVPGAGR